MANEYNKGSVVRVTGTFTDPYNNDAPIDPTTVYLSIEKPDFTIVTYQYGVDNEVIQSSIGVYYADLTMDIAGKWRFEWWSTGVGQTSDKGWYQISPSIAS